jgi:superfamily II DNA or RNA helicase
MTETVKPVVRIIKVNNTWGHVLCDDIPTMESLYKRFSVPVDNYWFMPKYRAGVWDGKIHFITESGRFYNGLLPKVLQFFGDDYDIELDASYQKEFTDVGELKREFIEYTDKTLTTLDPYCYQWRGAIKALYHKRAICEHGTGSGKSYTITMVVNFLRHKNINHKFLILVPKLDLIEQFYDNMKDFGIPEVILGKYCGHQKDTEQPIIISTWQSVYKNPAFLKKFTVFIADECHGLKADVVRSVAEKVVNCDWRLGFTGTMPDSKADHLLIQGVVGPVVDQALYDELQREKTISALRITLIKILYPDSVLSNMDNITYDLEKEFIENDPFRNNIICKIADKFAKAGKNCLILVKKIDHGQKLMYMLQENGHDPSFVYGDVDINDRNDIRRGIEEKEGQIIVATTGVYSTGVSINRLHVLIFASSGKSKIQTLQSVGRGLRKHPTKTELQLFDIGENCHHSKKHINVRIKYYEKNKFNYNIKEVNANVVTQ